MKDSSRLSAARRTAFTAADPGFSSFELGISALKDAQQLGNSQVGEGSALLLYRSAIRLLVLASLLRRREIQTLDPPWPEVWTRAAELPGWPRATTSRDWLERGVISEGGEAHLATLTALERERALVDMRTVAESVATPLAEAAFGVRRLLWVRRVWWSLALLVGGAFVWVVVAAVTRRPNLALHRPVTVSDRDPVFGVDPQQVVDGDRSNLGFHTTSRANTTLSIDLGAVKPLTRIVVFNRADCCQDRVGPLSLQLSPDGNAYETVARRTDTFFEWSVSLPAGTRARYVRVVHESKEVFHLSEVEVY
jgi:hypothetical protein